ncbi:hypothetical protein [Leptolyngbya sp. 7M]|uniref:hypothetical protein n=1 Tax=Leptolyngbya sp. 7M TaxID=2812896 RepID=UPI001B8B300A|nr:hypothetical protein [Leptolyngbya sp. 7M]QYO64338.1 hypothetical protein JVX88_32310 [Leptolyngbya sp. 7M]
MHQFDPDWCLPNLVDRNPLVWMLSVNGLLMDIRQAPFGAQVEAFRQGLIPYIPGHQEDSEAILTLMEAASAQPSAQNLPARKTTKTAKTTKTKTAKDKAAKSKALKQPSSAALQALYVLDGRGPNDPNADRYGLAIALQNDFDSPVDGDVVETLMAPSPCWTIAT